MKINLAQMRLKSRGRAATYTAPDDDAMPVPIRAIVQDRDSAIAMGEGLDVVTCDAVGFVAFNTVQQSGEIEQDRSVYRVDAVGRSKMPGLDRLELSRISGLGVVRFDNSASIKISAMSEVAEIDGVLLSYHVNEQGLYYEDQGFGVPVETQRLTVEFKESEVLNLEIGDTITLRGDTYQVADRQRTGSGKVRIVL